MFDYVEFTAECPTCGAMIDEFQSKDLGCGMDRVKPWNVDRFYAMCQSCETWIEYTRATPRDEIPPPPNWLNKFTRTAQTRPERDAENAAWYEPLNDE